MPALPWWLPTDPQSIQHTSAPWTISIGSCECRVTKGNAAPVAPGQRQNKRSLRKFLNDRLGDFVLVSHTVAQRACNASRMTSKSRGRSKAPHRGGRLESNP